MVVFGDPEDAADRIWSPHDRRDGGERGSRRGPPATQSPRVLRGTVVLTESEWRQIERGDAVVRELPSFANDLAGHAGRATVKLHLSKRKPRDWFRGL